MEQPFLLNFDKNCKMVNQYYNILKDIGHVVHSWTCKTLFTRFDCTASVAFMMEDVRQQVKREITTVELCLSLF